MDVMVTFEDMYLTGDDSAEYGELGRSLPAG